MAVQSETRRLLWVAGLVLFCLGGGAGRIHRLQLTEEKRSIIQVTSFGFFANGTLEVNVSHLHFSMEGSNIERKPIGFSLSRSRIGQFFSSTEQELNECALEKKPVDNLFLIVDFKSSRVQLQKLGNLKNIQIFPGLIAAAPMVNLELTLGDTNQSSGASKGKKDLTQKEKTPVQKRDIADVQTKPDEASHQSKPDEASHQSKPDETLDQTKPGETSHQTKPGDASQQSSGSAKAVKSDVKAEDLYLPLEAVSGTYNFSFHIVFSSEEEGLYNLYFHNCHNIQDAHMTYNITVLITERNPGGYLSAAEIPLFKLYLIMAGSFFTASIIWVSVLHKHKFSVFKIHWLMAALVFTKSISLLFHSINYYFINTKGYPIESLAVMYYITHVLKGVLLFITIVLIGTGWAFVKYILSDKDKKIFMIVLPLQVLANVAYIIIESSETGTSDSALWKQIVFLVDLICCGAILFPVIWSIRHLQEASSTDGKAAMNLAKLKLFRHYYIMIVCYIYFSRIIAILLQVTVSFQLQWLHEMLVEVSTLVFFVLTGYKFRPASNNPYLQLPQEDEDMQMDEVVTESGVLGGVSRVNKTFNGPETL